MSICTHCNKPISYLIVRSPNLTVTAFPLGKMYYAPGAKTRMCFKCPECMEPLFYKEEKARNFLLGITPPEKKKRIPQTTKW